MGDGLVQRASRHSPQRLWQTSARACTWRSGREGLPLASFSGALEAFILEAGSARSTSDSARIHAALAEKKSVWIDLDAPSADTDRLLEVLRLHSLTVEDIWFDRSGPKIDEFPDYVYICAHTLRRHGAEIVPIEVDLVVGKHFVLTHDKARVVTDTLREELGRCPRVLSRGPPWVAYAVLDALVDAYMPLIDDFDDEIERVEEEVLAKAGMPEGTRILPQVLALRRSLQALRRMAIHQREVLMRLARGEFAFFPPEVLPYLRDVYDHFVRVGDLAESCRDLVTSTLEVFLSAQSNRMNEVMKTLTLISTVTLPLTFIAGVYGMNFEHMPELAWRWGYAFALLLMAVVAGCIVLWFRHKRWL
jgi:magnesium transporter